MAISTYLSIITLNVNGLNAPIKRHKVVFWMKNKEGPSICCLQDTHRQKNEEMEKDISCKWKQNENEDCNTPIRQNRP